MGPGRGLRSPAYSPTHTRSHTACTYSASQTCSTSVKYQIKRLSDCRYSIAYRRIACQFINCQRWRNFELAEIV